MCWMWKRWPSAAVSDAAEALLPAIQAELDWLFERCTVMPTVKPELVRCRYGNDANLIGALKLFFEQNPA